MNPRLKILFLISKQNFLHQIIFLQINLFSPYQIKNNLFGDIREDNLFARTKNREVFSGSIFLSKKFQSFRMDKFSWTKDFKKFCIFLQIAVLKNWNTYLKCFSCFLRANYQGKTNAFQPLIERKFNQTKHGKRLVYWRKENRGINKKWKK